MPILVTHNGNSLSATAVFLKSTPTEVNHATTKAYVDGLIATGATKAYVDTSISNLVNGTGPALDTLKELATALNNDASFSTTVTTSIAAKAPTESPTFTGTVTLPSTAITGNLQAATKAYVDAKAGAQVTISDTAPTSPAAGAIWFNSSNGITSIYYDSSWVDVGGGDSVSSLFTGTLVDSYTIPANGASVSCGIQPAGIYRLEYVNGYIFVNSGATNPLINVEVTYPYGPEGGTDTDSFTIDYTSQNITFWQRGIIAMTLRFADNPYTDNSGSGITWNLYRIS